MYNGYRKLYTNVVINIISLLIQNVIFLVWILKDNISKVVIVVSIKVKIKIVIIVIIVVVVVVIVVVIIYVINLVFIFSVVETSCPSETQVFII